MHHGGQAILAARTVVRGLIAPLSRLTWLPGVILVCFALASSDPAWARGPLLLPDSPPPNLATLDTDALRNRATRGDPAAEADLGAAYAHGWKVRRDPAEAMRWLLRAASAKNRTGRRELGLLLLRGDGAARDPDQAVTLLSAAAEAGDMVAAAALGAAFASRSEERRVGKEC